MASGMGMINNLLDEVFMILKIIKVEVGLSVEAEGLG